MRFWQHAQRHQGHGGRQIRFFRQGAHLFRRVNHPAAQVQHRTLCGINHRRRFLHAFRIKRRGWRSAAGSGNSLSSMVAV
jgi:hypothetical protein